MQPGQYAVSAIVVTQGKCDSLNSASPSFDVVILFFGTEGSLFATAIMMAEPIAIDSRMLLY